MIIKKGDIIPAFNGANGWDIRRDTDFGAWGKRFRCR